MDLKNHDTATDHAWQSGMRDTGGRYYYRAKDGRSLVIKRISKETTRRGRTQWRKRWQLTVDGEPAKYHDGHPFKDWETAESCRKVADSYNWTTGRAVNDDTPAGLEQLRQFVTRGTNAQAAVDAITAAAGSSYLMHVDKLGTIARKDGQPTETTTVWKVRRSDVVIVHAPSNTEPDTYACLADLIESIDPAHQFIALTKGDN